MTDIIMDVRLTTTLFIIGVLLHSSKYSHATRCFECHNITDPSVCRSVVTCASTEYCYTEQVVTVAGDIVYNTGCKPQGICGNTMPPILIGRRRDPDVDLRDLLVDERHERATDISTCVQCCNNDFCNIEGCGTQATPHSQRGTICFTCNSTQDDPAKCSTVSVCDKTEVCFVYIPPEFQGHSETFYRSECISKASCTAMSNAVINANCPANCCENDFCNDVCGSLSPLPVATATSPVTGQTTSPDTTQTTLPANTVQPATEHTGCKSDHYYDGITGMCIQIIENQQLAYQEAKQACEAMGDRLITVDSHEKTTFIDTMILYHSSIQTVKDRIYWTSAYDVHNKTEFYWLNGEKMVYTNWGGGDEVVPNQQPDDHHAKNQDCVVLYGVDGYRWADDHCWTQRYFICETPSTLLHSGTPDTANSCKVGHYHDSVTGLCIKIVESQTVTYSQAKAACEHVGDRLVTIDSHEKTIFIDNLLIHQSTLLDEHSRKYWIGAHDDHNKDVFHWPNGQAVHYTNWGGGNEVAGNQQPDNGSQDCVVLYGPDHYRWHDDGCSLKYYYICEYTVPVPTHPPTHGPLCYTCSATDQPGACQTTSTCNLDEKCLLHTSPELSAAAGHLVYTTQCSPTAACTVIASLNQNGVCHAKCCDTDLCNNQCANTATCPTANGWQTLHQDGISMCIKVHTNHDTWASARSTCHNDHGELVVMDTAPKMQLIRDLVTHDHSYSAETAFWFGAYDKDRNDQFVWVNTGSSVNHGDWDHGQPNHFDGNHAQDCAIMWRGSNIRFQWHDENCEGRYSFICEHA